MSHFSDINNAFTKQFPVNYDYSANIIKPPDRNKTHGTITKTLVIDSRDRDYTLYPDSNKFRVEITEEYRDVTSLELVYGRLPNNHYNIKESNNHFIISENNTIYDIKIPVGTYDNQKLINVLNGKDGNLFNILNNNYNFSINDTNLKFRIQSNGDFIYNFNYELNNECSPCPIKNIDRIIGFRNEKYFPETIDLSFIHVDTITNLNENSESDYKLYKIKASSSTTQYLDFREKLYKGDYIKLNAAPMEYLCKVYKILNENTIEIEILSSNNILPLNLSGNIIQNMFVLNSPYIYNIENKEYIILKIKDVKLVNSYTQAVNNSYTVIPLLNNNTVINKATLPEHGVIKYFNPPMGKLFWLDIEFLNYDGSLFDFNGQENMLMFVVSQFNQPGKYNNILDTL